MDSRSGVKADPKIMSSFPGSPRRVGGGLHIKAIVWGEFCSVIVHRHSESVIFDVDKSAISIYCGLDFK